MKREFLTLPNLLSIFRAFLAVPFTLVMLLPDEPLRLAAAGIVALGMVTDKLDGDIARARGQETEWGRILDPLADKICVAVMALVLMKLGDLPVGFVGALLGRDLLILAGGLYIKKRRGIVVPSNAAGKWTVTAIAVTMLVAILGVLASVRPWLIAVCVAGLAVSLVMYGARFIQILSGGEARA
ncbi:MAG TPA: CDP-alcohol phosphatidyltransferase family protein [Bacteroidota bacterium]|nr:CDP-alcohol phosphatidyltransferase family protein [Bacteroidota bacterium]